MSLSPTRVRKPSRNSAAFPDDRPIIDDDGIAANAIYLTTKVGLEAGNEIIVNIRGVTLKPHGTDNNDQDPMSGVGSYAITVSTAHRRW